MVPVMLGISSDDQPRYDSVGTVIEGSRLRLKEEIKRRRVGEEEFAGLAGVSYTWLRKILAGETAGPKARENIRRALTVCTVCGCTMDVPPDDELFAVVVRRRRKPKASA